MRLAVRVAGSRFFISRIARGRGGCCIWRIFILRRRVVMKTLAEVAKGLECKRFVWQALDWNTPAIEFYEKIGAEVLKEWVSLRMDEEAINKFLES
mmetsp:Transcript_13972/g.25618  ORF Transcript_13972/g.25618 Transcript_13972/m.25618 type:complete len:96 (-) Transcript_13972:42-329(-)